MTKIQAIHHKILKEKIRMTVAEVKSAAPKIHDQAIVDSFKEYLRGLKFVERFKLAWKLMSGKF